MHTETMSDSALFSALSAKAHALRTEADEIEHFALFTLNKGPQKPTEASEKPSAYVPKNPKLTDMIETLISAAPGGKLDRKTIIQEIRRLSRGHTKHIAVVAALRNADRFKDIGEGIFALAK